MIDHSILDSVAMQPTGMVPDDDGLPVLTHQGVLKLFGHKLQCGRLSNGKTIFYGEEFEKLLAELLSGKGEV